MNKNRLLAVLAIVAGSLLSTQSFATALGFTMSETPDIVSQFLTVSYNAGSDELAVSGFAMAYDNDGIGSAEVISDGGGSSGIYTMTAIVDGSGNLVSGNVSIFGDIDSLGINDPTNLLTGELTAIGAASIGGIIDFLFIVTGGALADAYGGIGATAANILTFTGFMDWGTSFQNNNLTAQSDTGVLPASEPGILFLQGLGLLMLVSLRRRKAR